MNNQNQRARTVGRLAKCLTAVGVITVSIAAICFAQQAPLSPTDTAALTGKPLSANDNGAKTTGLAERNRRYELCLGDTFEVTFPFTPEFNQTVTIQPDGFIALAGLGSLQVAGKTVPEASELIRIASAHILHDPTVDIVLKEFEKPYFIASGELGHPGKYDLRSDVTLTQAVAIAGGFTENSKHSDVLLFRRVANNWVELKRVDVKKMFNTANLTEDVHLQPGDMVFVPQNRYSKWKRYIPSPQLTATPY